MPDGPDAVRRVLTLGGLRPGSVYCVIPGRPQLEWKSCMTRDESRAGSHVSFLASTDDVSLYCPTCRPHDREAFVEIADRIYASLASGNKAEGILADHPFARMLLRVSLKTTRAKRWAQTGPEVDGGPVPGALQAPVEAVIGSERPAVGVTAGETAIERQEVPGVTAGETAPTGVRYTAHCCPRIVLGHGLHSPACANYAGEAGAVMPAIPRDDPKAEAGSFERRVPWRPAYKDRADYDEWLTERAAIFQFLGGMSREVADRQALKFAGPPP